MSDIYYATADEVEQLDEAAVENGLDIRQMMELAGFHMLEVFERETIFEKNSVLVVCGKGNKAGDGLAAARHLINHGYSVSVALLDDDLKDDPAHHLRLLERMQADINRIDNAKALESIMTDVDVIIDAMIGYHLDGVLRGVYADAVLAANSADSKVIAYDVPTGLDATDGKVYDSAITAEATLTLAVPKQAFNRSDSGEYVGHLYLGDIGIPQFIYDVIDIQNPFINRSSVISI